MKQEKKRERKRESERRNVINGEDDLLEEKMKQGDTCKLSE